MQCVENQIETIEQVSDNIIKVFSVAQKELSKNSSQREKKIWINHLNISIRDTLKIIRKKSSVLSLGTRKKLYCNLGHLKRIRAIIQNNEHKIGAGVKTVRSDRVKWLDVKTAFNSRIRTGIIVNLKHIDIISFFDDAFFLFKPRILNALKAHNLIKVNTLFCGEFIIKKADSQIYEYKYFNTKNFVVDQTTDLKQWFQNNVIEIVLKKLEEFQERDSGWALHSITNLEININKHEFGNGASSHIKLPTEISGKKACINIENNDNACFYWSVVAALYPTTMHNNRTTSYPHFSRVLQTANLTLPITLNQIDQFEKLNNISINVYILEMFKNKEKCFFQTVPVKLTKQKLTRHVNLLLIQDKYVPKVNDYEPLPAEMEVDGDDELNINYHYCLIKDLSRLVSSQLSKNKRKKFICDRCLNYFSLQSKLDEHSELCEKKNFSKISFPKYDFVNFKNFIYKQRAPFVIYADFESLLKKMDSSEGKRFSYQHHEAFSCAYYFKCFYDNSLSYFKSFRGDNCVEWFTNELKNIASFVDLKMKNVIPLTENLHKSQAQVCHICEKKFEDRNDIVQDHDHFTGKFRGFAHNECNLNFKKLFIIPVLYHNLSGYDGHFLIRTIAKYSTVSLLPLNKEKYISFTQFDSETCLKFRYIDSFKFLSASLSELANTLNKDDFKVLKSEFQTLDSERFELLTRKGVFCYDYLDSLEKLNDTGLPPIADFYNKLNDDNISSVDYEHAQNVWEKFQMNNLGEYSDLYLKVDVLLLADIFEKFRNNSHSTYGLDPVWYFTLPGYTWDCMLKYTKCNLKLLKDIDQILFIEKGLRGGISVCSNRYSEANNKYMKNFDSTKPSKYLLYLDANNLYGWAMSQYLPYDDFQWISPEDFDVTTIPDDANEGFILEVDLKYPTNLHDLHKDLPFCSEHLVPPGSKMPKLLATLNDKTNYVIHYRNLKQVLKHGLVLQKVHKILKFKQSPWLKTYIDLNTKLRSESTSNFNKNLFKLMNNAVFGKTMENIRKHRVVKIVNKWNGRYGAKNLIASPSFHSREIIDENLVIIELKKHNLKFNKPLYIGMSILDISKTLMYEFHYEFVLDKFAINNCKLMYTDTDSFIYEIISDDIYKDFIKEHLSKFDTSDYPDNNVYNIPLVNKKVLGLMKDEANGKIISHFIGLRSKMYTFQIEGDCVKKIKGIKSNVIKQQITFSDYLECLKSSKEKLVVQRFIQSFKHKIYSMEQTKIALNPFDDKRYLLRDNFDTIPWGHYSISHI